VRPVSFTKMSSTTISSDLERIGPLVLVVALLHAVLLGTTIRSSRSPGDAGVVGAVQVRMIERPMTVEEPAATRSLGERLGAVARIDPSPSIEQIPRATAEAVASPPPIGKPADVSPPLPAFGLVIGGPDNDDDYFHRSALSRAPQTIEPVVIDYPAIDKDEGHYRSELLLFIDENGRVVRVRVEGAALPPALEAAARSAFMSARFHAGQTDGRAVKSKIRVEVVFDNRASNGK